MEVMEALLQRQSVKSYLPTPVEPEKLEQVLEAGRLAPSAFNHQYRRFIVVDDPAVKHLLREKAGAQPMIEEAPVVLVLCATEETDFVMPCGECSAPVDMALCGAYMMLQACALGLGTCWLGAFDADAVKRTLALPEDAIVVAVSPLGHPAEQPDPRPRKAPSEVFDLR